MSTTLPSEPNGGGINLEYKDKPRPATLSSTSASRSPYLPTAIETFIFSVYLATLVIGSLFSLLDPSARAAPYNASTQSHPSHLAPSYFAQKHNLFNLLFVKIGWFWTSLAFLIFIFSHTSVAPPGAAILAPKRMRAVLRWLLVTSWWIVVTQWFFGPPLMDRAFTLTGGKCVLETTHLDLASDKLQLFSSAACKITGGKWRGGYDLSGHVFLLVLAGSLLWLEVLHVIMHTAGLKDERVVAGGAGAASAEVRGVEDEKTEKETRPRDISEWGVGVKVVLHSQLVPVEKAREAAQKTRPNNGYGYFIGFVVRGEPKQETFFVHGHILCAKSQFVKSYYEKHKETRKVWMIIEDAEPVIFEILVELIYCDDPLEVLTKLEFPDDVAPTLPHLYLAAEKVGIRKFMNIDIVHIKIVDDEWLPSNATLRWLYQKTNEKSGLHQLLVAS
ncbi:hypothetical protein FGG08_004179 [Glutinoglossum americanum]|uniref:BTB domain-containing protein n=1 Tax=Glutinoglossum americanum TaxID=1670608 RepID=A0A9P8L459_9PEZI|nr:hypothetical protein FGG08_004179 [Glutinoglossum americanum]